jgi:hypothetical protein
LLHMDMEQFSRHCCLAIHEEETTWLTWICIHL